MKKEDLKEKFEKFVSDLENFETTLLASSVKHTPDCNWWKDWHDCSCGAFDKK